jgi:putative transposase
MRKHHKVELLYHLILTAKYRNYFWISDDIIKQSAASAKMNLVEYCNDTDHLHMLIELPPTIAISKIIEIFKSQSSRLMKHYHCRDWHSWSRGYHISSVGAEEEVIKDYIRRHFK